MKSQIKDLPTPEPTPAGEKKPTERPTLPDKKPLTLLQRILRWALAVLVVFGLGALLITVWLYLPQRSLLNTRQAELNQSQQRAQELDRQVAALSTQVAAGEALQGELDQSEAHVALLLARNDVLAALLALERDDLAAASIALENTSATLERVAAHLAPDQRSVVSEMQTRLDLAIAALETDPNAAQSDLDLLAASLLELQIRLIR